MDVDYMSERLDRFDEVTRVMASGGVVSFDVDAGSYDALTSELLSVIGEHDCSLYTFPDEDFKYRLV